MVAQEEDRGQYRDDLDAEHDRFLDQGARIELAERGPDQRAVEDRERPELTLVEPGVRRADHNRGDVGHGMSSGIPLPTAPDGACPGSSRLARPPARVRR